MVEKLQLSTSVSCARLCSQQSPCSPGRSWYAASLPPAPACSARERWGWRSPAPPLPHVWSFKLHSPGAGVRKGGWIASWICKGSVPSVFILAGRVNTTLTASEQLRFNCLRHETEIPAVTNAASPYAKRSECRRVISAAPGEGCCPTTAENICPVTYSLALDCTTKKNQKTPRGAFTNLGADLVNEGNIEQ